MVWSPSVRVFAPENADNLVQKKTRRKPFVDRSVNSKTPDTQKLLKPKQNFATEPETVEVPKSPKEDLNAEEDVEDTYDDMWPRLSKRNIVEILHNYCNREDTLPPSPALPMEEISPIFFELPEVDVPQLIEEDNWNQTFEVEMPDYDDFDMSI
ncbi:hypothetical protein NQ317_016587 [Molorchus minor]|uniref:Uncharacterized protein n=1 Tax=Molorchus minor TaxID=1323400 RepID=A0ABQ9IZH0_9CUCU|nr:hypothetical protein NQ317_016587 [Molorchus minor]